VAHLKQVYQRRELLLNEPTNVILGVERSNVVSGGTSNAVVASTSSTIKQYNEYSTIPLFVHPDNSTILGSTGSTIESARGSAILGSTNCLIQAQSELDANTYSVIVGGSQSSIITEGLYSSHNTIVGAQNSSIQGVTWNSSLIGGTYNSIDLAANKAIILGGTFNRIDTNSDDGIIAGGRDHDITNSERGAILGGGTNRIANSFGSAIMGGALNTIDGFDYVTMVGCVNVVADQDWTTYVNRLNLAYMATSAAGLTVGTVWRNGTVLNVVV